jgi:hypothetical protein
MMVSFLPRQDKDAPIVVIYPLDSPTNRRLPVQKTLPSKTGSRSIRMTQS